MAKMIDVKNVFYSYKIGEGEEEITALSDVSFHVEKGEFVALIGHNGSGKSTLAKLLNGIFLPKAGDVEICGMNTKNEEDIWKIRQKAGMVFQNPDNQMVATVVEEDVAFGPENLGVEPREIRRRIDEALERVGMSDFKDKQPQNLSGGQKQRIAIAGVLAMESECIILDEPTAMLDPVGRREVLDAIKMLNRENNTTIVFITHYMDEVINANRVIVMDEGKIAMEGSPKDIFARVGELRALDLDVPFAASLSYDLSNKGIKIKQTLDIDELAEEICQLK